MSSPLADYPAFRNFFFSRVATSMANQMMMVVVAWQMYDLTHSAFDLGMVGLAQFLPALALALVTGQVADRFDRRLVLADCLAGQLMVSALPYCQHARRLAESGGVRSLCASFPISHRDRAADTHRSRTCPT